VLDELGRFTDAHDLVSGQPGEQRRKIGDPTFPAVLHHTPALRSGVEMMDAAVLPVTRAPGEACRLEPLDDARHRRRADLLRCRKLAESARAAEDEHGQSRELRRWDARRRILAADVPQGVDRRRVETVRRFD
jgi:hypothetical protein